MRRASPGLFARYDVGTPRRCRAVSLGIENSNYFVTTVRSGREHEWVLTLLEQPSYCGARLRPPCSISAMPPGCRWRRSCETRRAMPPKPGSASRPLLALRLPGAHVDVPRARTPGNPRPRDRRLSCRHRQPPPSRSLRIPRDQRWLSDRSASTAGAARRPPTNGCSSTASTASTACWIVRTCGNCFPPASSTATCSATTCCSTGPN